jgi:hypothetical protein
VRWNDRFCTCNAVVVPDTSEVLLGVLQLEDMDLKVDPTMEKLEGAHGDTVVRMVR